MYFCGEENFESKGRNEFYYKNVFLQLKIIQLWIKPFMDGFEKLYPCYLQKYNFTKSSITNVIRKSD